MIQCLHTQSSLSVRALEDLARLHIAFICNKKQKVNAKVTAQGKIKITAH